MSSLTRREEYALKKLEKYMDHFGLLKDGWDYGLDNPKRRAGQCDYSKKKITLGKLFVNKRRKVSRGDIKNTILHEIAHAFTPGHQHDKVWKDMAIKIGCDGKRCCKNYLEMEDYKYVYTCKLGCMLKRHRRSKLLDDIDKYGLKCKKHNLKIFKIHK